MSEVDKGLHKQKMCCFLSEVLQNRHCNGFFFSLFFCPSESLSPRRVRSKSSNSNTLEAVRTGQRQGGGSGFQGRGFGGGWGSGVGGVDGGFVARGHASVPAAVALLLLDAGVVPGLVARIAKVGQHVRP